MPYLRAALRKPYRVLHVAGLEPLPYCSGRGRKGAKFLYYIKYMTVEDIALTFVPHLGVRGAVHLLRCFGSAAAIYSASEEEIRGSAELRADVAHAIAERKGMREAEREMEYCRRHGLTPVASTDECYPPLLLETDDYPSVLYVKGDTEVLRRRSVAFVGTRKMTSYGSRMCDVLLRDLAEAVPDAVVVSGLAYGIDSACHHAALTYGLATVGVLANALPAVTPAPHERLAASMVAKGGALVTELNSQTKQNGRFFVPRNRLIAGMCEATVVVESPEAGGAMVTASLADGYNRTLLAVPGRATDEFSRGTNALIFNRKAQPVMSGRDIVRELMWDGCEPAPAASAAAQLSAAERALLEHFDSDPVTADVLLMRSGLGSGELAALLMNMELAGVVRRLRGNRYEKMI